MTQEKEAMSKEEATSRLLMILSRHVGKEHAVDMERLYERVFGEKVAQKINHTRKLRTLVTVLRNQGIPIGSTSAQTGGGYYLVRAGSELNDYCNRLRRRALNALVMEARLRKIALPELLGQMRLNLTEGGADAGSDDAA